MFTLWLTGQAVDFFAELVEVLEAPVHRGKTDIGDFVELAQLGHHQFTDHQRFDFALAGGAQAALDVRQRRFQALDAHRAFPSARCMPARSLSSSKGWRVPSCLISRGSTSSAVSKVVKRSPQARHSRRRRTCSPSATRRVDDLGVVGTAKGTVHGGRQQKREGHGSALHWQDKP
jgi:hypothetical protein